MKKKLKGLSIHIIIMPVLMMLLAGSIVLISFMVENIKVLHSTYFISTFLFFFFPLSTVDLVYRKFNIEKQKNIYKRMFITTIPGIINAILFFTPFWKVSLILVGLLGFIYFLFDFFKQRKTYKRIQNKLEKIIKNQEIFDDIISTKCSRSMIERATKEHSLQLWKRVRRKIRKKGFRWWHLFPTGKRSLTAEIFS